MLSAIKTKINASLGIFMRYWVFVFKRFMVDGCFSTAAALSFTTVLSIVPCMAIIVAILRIMPSAAMIGEQVTQFIFQNFVPETGEVVQQYLQMFIQQSGQLSWLGAIFLLFTSLMMLVTMENALNGIWRVSTQRQGMKAFMVYWALLTLAPLFIVGSIGISSYFFSINLFDLTTGAQRNQFVTSYLPFLLAMCGFTFLYVVMPNCRVKVTHALVGGLVAACLFELSKDGFSFYISHFPAYKLIYGALASIPIFLLWVYLAWLVALFGAEVTNALTYDHRMKRSGTGHCFMISLIWIEALWHAQKQGGSLSLAKLLRICVPSSPIETDQILNALVKAHIVRPMANGEYILVRNLSHMSVYEFYALLPWQIPHPADLTGWEISAQGVLEKLLSAVDRELKNTMGIPVGTLFLSSGTITDGNTDNFQRGDNAYQ